MIVHLKHPTAFQIQSPKIHTLPNKSMVRPITAVPQSLVPTLILVRIYYCEHIPQPKQLLEMRERERGERGEREREGERGREI